MIKYDFDHLTNRIGSNSVKYDLLHEIFGTDDLLSMWVADMDFDTPSFIFEAISDRIKHPILGYSIRSKSFHQSITYWLESRYQWTVDESHISFSPGVVPGLLMAMMSVSKSDDKIIVQTPVYFPFFTTVKENDRQLIFNPLIEKNNYYTMDYNHLESIIDKKTKAIFICNPHNPVGRSWNKSELNQLVEICYKNKITIISDEIHADLILKPHQHIPLASISDNAAEITITLMAPSKTFNIAGLSTSFVIAQNPVLLKNYNSILEAFHLRQGNIFGTVATQSAYSLEGAEWVDQMMDYVSENINYVVDYIASNLPQITLQKPESTYLLWLNMKSLGMNDEELLNFFTYKVGIAINQGKIFGQDGSGYIRLNVATSKKRVIEAMKKIKLAIESL